MFRLVLLCAAAAMEVQSLSPNAGLVKKLLNKPKFKSRYSSNLVEDAMLDVPSLITKYGYPVETHRVVTDDGYVLEAHRIPHGRRHQHPGKPAVFLMHGLLSSSADFVVLGPENALAYLLAEEGYDVWLGNARGNFYSRHHLTLDPDHRNQDFWRYSWEQIGYILAETGQRKLHYIGHSQGGTVFLVLNSLRPEYNEKFISFQGLAPAAYFTNNENSIFNMLAPYEKIIETAAFSSGHAEILTNSQFSHWVANNACIELPLFQPLCAASIVENDTFEHMNATMIPVFFGHAPAGSSIRQVAHYAQTIRRNTFARFYFDPITNLRLYGRINPPAFDMSLVTVPTYLYYGMGDREVDYRDVHLLAERLGNTVGMFKVDRESFNHFDIIWGSDVKTQLYDTLIESLKLEGNSR